MEQHTLWTVRSPSGLRATCFFVQLDDNTYFLTAAWSGRPLVRERYATLDEALIDAELIEGTLLNQYWRPDGPTE